MTIAASLIFWTFAAIGLRPRESPAEEAAVGKKIALLIGINEYDKPGFETLLFAERDVDELGKELNKQGFRVVVLKGSSPEDLRATRENIRATLKRVFEPLGKHDIGLVAFSGHGEQLPVPSDDGGTREDGFVCPVDAVQNDAATQVSLSEITDKFLSPHCGRCMLLVDACRSVPPRQARGRRRGIQGKVVALPENTGVLFSCRAGEESLESPRLEHGLFTHCVLEGLRGKAMQDGQVDWDGLVSFVKRRMDSDEMRQVLRGVRQTPISAGGLQHTVLARAVSPAATAPATPRPMPDPPAKPTNSFKNSVEMTLVPIPAGEFLMGSPESEDGHDASEHRHRVRISTPFFLGAHETTVKQFSRFVAATGHRTEAETSGRGGWGFNTSTGLLDTSNPKWTWRSPGFQQPENHPVVNVSWNDAQEFCRWLGKSEGRVYRLPTEAEWEYACRAGTTGRFGLGDDDTAVAQMANVADAELAKWRGASRWSVSWSDRHAFTSSVGHFKPNAWGLYDMHGNVWEWVADWYDPNYYRTSPAVDPKGPSSGAYRMFRGGGWFNPPRICRSANRNVLTPADYTNLIGFRVVCESANVGR